MTQSGDDSSVTSTRIVVPALVMVSGLVTLGWAFMNEHTVGFYVGLAVTLAGAMSGLVFALIREPSGEE